MGKTTAAFFQALLLVWGVKCMRKRKAFFQALLPGLGGKVHGEKATEALLLVWGVKCMGTKTSVCSVTVAGLGCKVRGKNIVSVTVAGLGGNVHGENNNRIFAGTVAGLGAKCMEKQGRRLLGRPPTVVGFQNHPFRTWRRNPAFLTIFIPEP